MTESIIVADDITGRASLITTCPPAFVKAGSMHRFDTSGSIRFENGANAPVLVEITLTLNVMRPDRELDRHVEVFEVPPGAPTVYNANWSPEYHFLQSDKTILIRLKALKKSGNQGQVVSTWHVCEFTVE